MQTAKVCEQIIISSMNLSVQVMPDEFYRTRMGMVREMSIRIIAQVLASFFHWNEETMSLQKIKELMAELLIGHLSSRWDMMLNLVKDLPALASVKLSQPSFIDTEQASELLQKIYDEYNLLCGKPTIADRKSTRLNSSHQIISYAVFCLKKKKKALARGGMIVIIPARIGRNRTQSE